MVVDWITLTLGGAAVACAGGVWALTRPSSEPRRAVDYYTGLIRRNPEDKNARFELAQALLRRGKLAESIHQLRIITEQDPKHAPAHHSLGVALLSTGNASSALIHLEVATKLSPIFAEAFASLGAVLLMKGDTVGAKSALGKAVSLEPRLAIAHYNLARCYLADGEADKAVAALKQAIQQDRSMLDEAKCGTEFDSLMGHGPFRKLIYGS